MNLYLISRPDPVDYDEFDSAVVAAETAEEAAKIHPCERECDPWMDYWARSSWVESPDLVQVQFLGRAADGTASGVILASFNAG